VSSSHEPCSSYECGFEPLCRVRPRFCIQFFLICILFLIFDLEIGFVLPSLRRSHSLISFLLVLLFGLLLEYYYGGLDWLC
jgi:NADH:ubiquinone oxidoreductase subunit 3 (subunit A)